MGLGPCPCSRCAVGVHPAPAPLEPELLDQSIYCCSLPMPRYAGGRGPHAWGIEVRGVGCWLAGAGGTGALIIIKRHSEKLHKYTLRGQNKRQVWR